MVPCAPRYRASIVEAIDALDDGRMPVAELCRRVGALAERLGLLRPSYVHLRRYALAQRARAKAEARRRAELRAIASGTAERMVLGLRVDAYEVAEQVAVARGRYELVAQSHKPEEPD
jgi:hypothetical protein